MRTKCFSGTQMYRLQQYLRKKESPPVLPSSAPDKAIMKRPVSLPPELQCLVKELPSPQQTGTTVSAPENLPPSETSSETHRPEPTHTDPSVAVPPQTPEPPRTEPSIFVPPPVLRSDQDINRWTCSYHQKVWMRTELQSLGLCPGLCPVSHHMIKP